MNEFVRDADGNIIDIIEHEPEEGSDVEEKRPEPSAADIIVEAAKGDASKVFDAKILELAANFERTSPSYQALVPRLRAAKVRIQDWERAVKVIREEREKARKDAAKKAKDLEGMPPKEGVEQIRRWITDHLLTTPQHAPRANLANVITILVHDPVFRDRLAYHELRESEFKTSAIPWHADDAAGAAETGDWNQQDSTRFASWLSRTWNLDVHSKMAEEAVETVARRRVFNPVTEYLDRVGKSWDGSFRIGSPDSTGWLSAYLGAPDSLYTREVGCRWLIAAVARAFKPGCQADNMLTLISIKQGTGKSSLFRALCADESWFFDDELKIGDKEAAQVLRGKWIAEMSELSSMQGRQLEAVRAFVSRRVDSYRPTHARRSRDFSRRIIFGGSTNNPEPFTDEQNRRFLPVNVKTINWRGVQEIRDQLWGEAVFRYKAGAAWHIDTPELEALCKAEQELRSQADPWEAYFDAWLSKCLAETLITHSDNVKMGFDCECFRCVGVTVAGCLDGALKMPKAQANRAADMRGATVLRRLGWSRPADRDDARRSLDGRRVRPYFPPDGT